MTPATSKMHTADKPLTPAMEDYLEAIFDLSRNKNYARVKDIAKRMQVKMPTVTSMLKTLGQRGLVHYEKYEYVELTQEGAIVGQDMRYRHDTLLRFLTTVLHIDFDTANEDACKMEHALSTKTLDSFTDFMAFIQSCPRAGETWLQFFEEYRREGHRPEKCQSRLDTFTATIKDHTEGAKK